MCRQNAAKPLDIRAYPIVAPPAPPISRVRFRWCPPVRYNVLVGGARTSLMEMNLGGIRWTCKEQNIDNRWCDIWQIVFRPEKLEIEINNRIGPILVRFVDKEEFDRFYQECKSWTATLAEFKQLDGDLHFTNLRFNMYE